MSGLAKRACSLPNQARGHYAPHHNLLFQKKTPILWQGTLNFWQGPDQHIIVLQEKGATELTKGVLGAEDVEKAEGRPAPFKKKDAATDEAATEEAAGTAEASTAPAKKKKKKKKKAATSDAAALTAKADDAAGVVHNAPVYTLCCAKHMCDAHEDISSWPVLHQFFGIVLMQSAWKRSSSAVHC